MNDGSNTSTLTITTAVSICCYHKLPYLTLCAHYQQAWFNAAFMTYCVEATDAGA